jgi:hypothetical protein
MKRPELLPAIASGLVNGAAHRQIARGLRCAPSTVTRQSARIGRHSLLLLVLALEHLAEDREDTVLAHIESFEGARKRRFAIATLVGADSWFSYGVDGAPHGQAVPRRSFRDTRPCRRRTRTRHGHLLSARRLLAARALFAGEDALRVICDDEHDYRATVRSLALRGRVQLVVDPRPKPGPRGAPRSDEARAHDAAVFPNELLRRLARHSMAHHHIDTIAFPRRINAAMERQFTLAAWRNFVKKRAERRPERVTPAMLKRLATEPWSWERVFARRLFPDRLRVPMSWLGIYRREWITPALRSNTRHALHLAF